MVLEMTLPFWIEQRDVGVLFSPTGLDVVVKNTAHIARTFWRDR